MSASSRKLRTGVVGTFTDENPLAYPSDLHAMLIWANPTDGQTVSCSIQAPSGPDGQFTVTATVTLNADGQDVAHPALLFVYDNGGSADSTDVGLVTYSSTTNLDARLTWDGLSQVNSETGIVLDVGQSATLHAQVLAHSTDSSSTTTATLPAGTQMSLSLEDDQEDVQVFGDNPITGAYGLLLGRGAAQQVFNWTQPTGGPATFTDDLIVTGNAATGATPFHIDLTVSPAGSSSDGGDEQIGNAGDEGGPDGDAAQASGDVASRLFKVTSEEITFDGTQAVKKDDGSGTYDTTQWIDDNGDGTPDNNADVYFSGKGAPLSYVESSFGHDTTPNLRIVLTGAGIGPDGEPTADLPDGVYHIVGYGSGPTDLVWEGDATKDGNVLTADLDATAALPTTVYDGDLKITWLVQYSGDAGADTELAPPSSDHLYVNGSAASAGQYETVLDVGCRNANGLDPSSDAHSALNAIWKNFALVPGVGASVVAADRKTVMTYNHDAGAGASTASLVSQKRGMCGAWGHFLVDVLQSQGINASPVEVLQKGQSAPDPSHGICVLAAPAQGSGTTTYNPGGNGNVLMSYPNVTIVTKYQDHVLVTSSVAPAWIFDPSYGERNSDNRIDARSVVPAKVEWEVEHLWGFVTIDQSTNIPGFTARAGGGDVYLEQAQWNTSYV